MGCVFCASTLEGKVRNLEPGEMLSQVLNINRDACEAGFGNLTNIVLMGSGEPLDNMDNVLKFFELVNCSEGINIGMRNISLSTCGLVDKIYMLAEKRLGITLSISLHAPNDEIRRKSMPIAKRYSIDQLIKATRDYVKSTGRRVIFEYTLINNLNDSIENAKELAERLRGMQCHVNLIPLNAVKERDLSASNRDNIAKFENTLTKLGISCSLRREMGSDISGACGQLRRRYLNEGELNS
jgi:23S rRNA (adenine2503-C2)-methyltransferase